MEEVYRGTPSDRLHIPDGKTVSLAVFAIKGCVLFPHSAPCTATCVLRRVRDDLIEEKLHLLDDDARIDIICTAIYEWMRSQWATVCQRAPPRDANEELRIIRAFKSPNTPAAPELCGADIVAQLLQYIGALDRPLVVDAFREQTPVILGLAARITNLMLVVRMMTERSTMVFPVRGDVFNVDAHRCDLDPRRVEHNDAVRCAKVWFPAIVSTVGIIEKAEVRCTRDHDEARESVGARHMHIDND